MKALSISLLGLHFVTALGLADNRPIGRSFVTRSEVLAQHGMVCTSQPLATQVALDILKAGGSAVDATQSRSKVSADMPC